MFGAMKLNDLFLVGNVRTFVEPEDFGLYGYNPAGGIDRAAVNNICLSTELTENRVNPRRSETLFFSKALSCRFEGSIQIIQRFLNLILCPDEGGGNSEIGSLTLRWNDP